MDWLKIETATPAKPEVSAVARRLGISVAEAFAGCFEVWRWAQDTTATGRIPFAAADDVDRRAGHPGFALALEAVGWLTISPGGLEFPGFDRHMGKGAKARALAAVRMAAKRLRAQRNESVTKGGVTREEKRREEEIRGEDIKDSPTESPVAGTKKAKGMLPPIPPALATPDFGQAWALWLEYRASRRKPVSPFGAAQAFQKLSDIGPARAVAAIRHSIAQDYQGIYEERPDVNKNQLGRSRATCRLDAPEGKYRDRDDLSAPGDGEPGGADQAADAAHAGAGDDEGG